ncbi:MAG: hypothetical protein ACPGGK_09140 [Pikeienuella sp.]
MAQQNEKIPPNNEPDAANLGALASAWLNAWEAEITAQAMAEGPSFSNIEAAQQRATKA